MNKKQLMVAWIMAVLLVIILGLETTTLYTTSEIEKPGGPEFGESALTLYGSLVLSAGNAGAFYRLLSLGHYRYQLIIGVLIIGTLLIYTFKSKIA